MKDGGITIAYNFEFVEHFTPDGTVFMKIYIANWFCNVPIDVDLIKLIVSLDLIKRSVLL